MKAFTASPPFFIRRLSEAELHVSAEPRAKLLVKTTVKPCYVLVVMHHSTPRHSDVKRRDFKACSPDIASAC